MVGYMDSATGLTKDSGWQLGLRRTVPVARDVAWRALLAEVGVEASQPGEEFVTATGIRGQVRSYRHEELIRMTWQPPGEPESTLQLRVTPAATGTTVGFHQDRLHSAADRAKMLEYWAAAIDRLRATLEK